MAASSGAYANNVEKPFKITKKWAVYGVCRGGKCYNITLFLTIFKDFIGKFFFLVNGRERHSSNTLQYFANLFYRLQSCKSPLTFAIAAGPSIVSIALF